MCGDVEWRNCTDIFDVPTLTVLKGDTIEGYDPEGKNLGAYYIGNPPDWSIQFSGNSSDTTFGNVDDDSECSPSVAGTCIEKGYIGRLGLVVETDGCDPTDCSGSCDDGIFGRDGVGYQCDCGVRKEMLDCYGVIGWLKFKEEVPV